MDKYKRWHDQIISRARLRKPLGCYSERHHILPRSLGGSDDPSNLVDLTYREHFLIHWILTKLHQGSELRRLQRGLFAVTIPVSKGRVVTRWQMRAVERLVGNLAVGPEEEAEWRKNYTRLALEKEDALRKRDSANFRDRKENRKKALVRLEEAVAKNSKLSNQEIKSLTDQLFNKSRKSIKHAFRPRRMIGPDGMVRSRQKVCLKFPEFVQSAAIDEK